VLEFRISWAVTLRLGETWWLEHEASTVSDMNHGSIDIKSPPCQLFYNSVSKYSVKYKDGVSPRRRDESELYSNKKEKNSLLLHIYLLQLDTVLLQLSALEDMHSKLGEVEIRRKCG
jgi:hypothetical protein